jgi:hypothetical protein
MIFILQNLRIKAIKIMLYYKIHSYKLFNAPF